MFIFFLIHLVKVIKFDLTDPRMQDNLGLEEFPKILCCERKNKILFELT
jgi:hypothetical protein